MAMRSEPIISVIVPAYDAARTILETVESVLGQTFQDFELIVVDDGSSDGTAELLKEISDSPLKVYSYENGGVAVARNRGIALAKGEFISFIDADDLWTPDKLESQLAALERMPEAGIAYSWTTMADENGEPLYPQKPVYFEGDVYPQLLVNNFIFSGSNILARREAIESVGEFDLSLRACQDWDCYVRLAAKWPFVLVPRHQIFYRQYSMSMSSRINLVEEEILVAAEKTFQSAPAELQRLKNQRLANCYQHIARLCLTHTQNAEGIKRAGQSLKKAIRVSPMILFTGKTQRLMLHWLLMRFVPLRIARSALKLFIKIYAKYRRAVSPG